MASFGGKSRRLWKKTILDAISSELAGYSFRKSISTQLSESIDNIAANCGLSAYNGFIAERVKAIVQDMYTTDMAQKVEAALTDVMFKQYKDVKLSDIFSAYRKWVLENTDESEQYERQKFTHRLVIEESGCFTHYTCTFADQPLENTYGEHGDIEFRLCQYANEERVRISTIYLNNRNISGSIRIGDLTEFEAFLLNLYYNRTEIIMDVDDVEENPDFIDY